LRSVAASLAAAVLLVLGQGCRADDPKGQFAAPAAEVVFAPQSNAAEALNQLIAALSAKGGGTVRLAGAIEISRPVVLRSNVSLVGGAGTLLRWTGDTKGPVLQTPADDTITSCAFEGLRVYSGAAALVFDIHSLYACRFRDLDVASESGESVIFRLAADSTAGEQPPGSRLRHIHASEFTNLAQHGKCGTFMQIRGLKERNNYQVVTVNSFHHLYSWGCERRGIDIQQWADSNAFTGIVRMRINGVGGVGLEINSAEPNNETGVYGITFTHLAIDNFGRGRSRTAVKINTSKHIDISALFNDPPAESGIVVSLPGAQSYDVRVMNGRTGKYDSYNRGTAAR